MSKKMSGLDEELEETTGEEKVVSLDKEKKKRKPFAYWEVGGRSYKLKLKTATICKIEDKFKTNLINLVTLEGLPPLHVMLTVIQGAMTPWEHDIKFMDVQKLFDSYCEEGGSQVTLMSDVLMPAMAVSGFFTESQAESLMESLKEADSLL